MVGKGKCFRKLVHECAGTGIGVRLEHTPDLTMRIIGSSFQSCPDLGRMMGIIIDNGDTVHFSFVLETTVCSVEHSQTFGSSLEIKAKFHGGRQGSQCIGYVVDTWYMKLYRSYRGSFVNQCEGCAALSVIGNIGSGVICLAGHFVCDQISIHTIGNLVYVLDFAIHYQQPVCREQFCKTMEGVADIGKILEEIQVVFLNVQDHVHSREKGQEAVGVLTCFGQKQI